MNTLHGPRLAGGLLTLVLVLAGGEGRLEAQTTRIDETRPIAADASVELRTVSHSLQIERWDRNEIRITGEYEAEWEEIEISGSERSFRFEVRHLDRRGSWSRRGSSNNLRIQLPAGVRLNASTVSGEIETAGLSGALSLSSVSGEIEVTGNLERVDFNSVSGAVTYRGNAPAVRLRTVSGHAAFSGNTPDLRMNSVSGRIEAAGNMESIDLQSVSGQVTANPSGPVRFAQMNAVSGDIHFTGALAPDATLEAESHSGRVELTLPRGTSARFELSTFSGGIHADFPGMENANRNRGRFTPQESVSFTSGSGSARVEASSFSGTIRIRGGG